jgi:hypothetical protein
MNTSFDIAMQVRLCEQQMTGKGPLSQIKARASPGVAD